MGNRKKCRIRKTENERNWKIIRRIVWDWNEASAQTVNRKREVLGIRETSWIRERKRKNKRKSILLGKTIIMGRTNGEIEGTI